MACGSETARHQAGGIQDNGVQQAWPVLAGREDRPDREQLLADARSQASLRLHHIAAIQAMRELMADYIREPLRACLVWQSGSTHRIQVPVE